MSSGHEVEHVGAAVAWLADPCDCPCWPVMYWLTSDGDWIPALTVDPTRRPDDDATRYDEMRCQAWQIACPACETTMAQGISPFLTSPD